MPRGLNPIDFRVGFAIVVLHPVICAGAEPVLPPEAIARVGSTRMRQGELVSGMAFMPDGKTLLTVGRSGVLRFWDTDSGELRRQVERGAPNLFHVAVADDGSTIGLGGMDRYFLLDAEGHELKRHLFTPADYANAIVSVVTSRDNKSMCTVHRNGSVLVRDPRSGEVKRRFAVDLSGAAQPFFGDCSFMPDGKAVAVVNMNERQVGLYDLATGKPYHMIKSVQDQVRVVLIAPDGATMATIGYRDNSVVLWDLATAKLRRQLKDVCLEPACIRFAPDSKTLAVGGAGPDVTLVDVASGTVQRRLAWPVTVTSGIPIIRSVEPASVVRVAYSADGSILAAANADGAIVLWNPATGTRLPVSADPAGSIREMRFIDSGKRLVAVADQVDVWDWATARRVMSVPVPGFSRACSISSDGALTAIPRRDQTIALIELGSGKTRHSLAGHSAPVTRTVFSPDGRRLFSGDQEQTFRVWDVATGKEIGQWPGSFQVTHVPAISPDGALLALAGGNPPSQSVIRLCEAATGREIRQLPMPQPFLYHVAFSPDGRLLVATSGSGRVVLWDVHGGKAIRSLEHLNSPAFCAAFSPDGRTLATGNSDNKIRLWEVATGQLRYTFAGHQGEIHALTFTADGRYLAAASLDAPVLIWDVYGHSKASPVSGPALRKRLWQELGDKDAGVAFKAVRSLAQSPGEIAPLCREHVKPVPRLDENLVRQWLDDLDDPRFLRREKATAELKQRLDVLEFTLRETLAKPGTTAEARRRLQTILDGAFELDPERLREQRALEALEQSSSREAVQLFEDLAKGEPAARLTRAAKESVARMRPR
jgi:WD40 repeat protein